VGYFAIIAPDGVELSLSSAPFFLLTGASGLVFPDVSYSTMRNPLGGDIVMDAWLRGRKIDLPVWVKSGFSAETYRGNMQRLVRAISVDPKNPSMLVYRGKSNRSIPVVLRSGAVWNDGVENANVDWAKIVLPLYAPTGAWQDENYITEVLSVGQGVAFLPHFPFRLTAGTIVGSGQIFVDGDMAFPRWEISGAATAVYLTNKYTDSTGGEVVKSCEFPSIDLNDNDTLIVDAHPEAIRQMEAVQIIRSNGDKENAWGLMSKVSEVWHLVSGNNNITVQALGSNENTQAVLKYKALHATPWTPAE